MAAQPDTDMRSRSLEERVSRIEGVFEHVATKADIERVIAEIERVRTESQTGIERLRTEFLTENERLRTELQTGLERNRTEIQTGLERLRTEFQTENERSRAEFQTGLERLRTEFQTQNERNRAEFRTESERNRTEIERNRADIIKIMIRLAGVGMALMALGFAFLRFTGTG